MSSASRSPTKAVGRGDLDGDRRHGQRAAPHVEDDVPRRSGQADFIPSARESPRGWPGQPARCAGRRASPARRRRPAATRPRQPWRHDEWRERRMSSPGCNRPPPPFLQCRLHGGAPSDTLRAGGDHGFARRSPARHRARGHAQRWRPPLRPPQGRGSCGSACWRRSLPAPASGTTVTRQRAGDAVAAAAASPPAVTSQALAEAAPATPPLPPLAEMDPYVREQLCDPRHASRTAQMAGHRRPRGCHGHGHRSAGAGPVASA